MDCGRRGPDTAPSSRWVSFVRGEYGQCLLRSLSVCLHQSRWDSISQLGRWADPSIQRRKVRQPVPNTSAKVPILRIARLRLTPASFAVEITPVAKRLPTNRVGHGVGLFGHPSSGSADLSRAALCYFHITNEKVTASKGFLMGKLWQIVSSALTGTWLQAGDWASRRETTNPNS